MNKTNIGKSFYRKVLALLLVLCVIGLYSLSSAAFAATGQIDKGKKASPTTLSGSNRTTKVTLSLPSTEVHSNADVVLVMDKSAYSEITDIETAANNMLDSFRKSNVNVKVGLVIFDAWGHDAYSLYKSNGKDDTVTGLVKLDSDSDLADLKAAASYKLSESDYYIGGSNSEQPVKLANSMLAKDTDTPDSNKYVVLMSDLETYVYEGNLKIGDTTYDSAPVSRNTSAVSTVQIYSGGSGYKTWDSLFTAWKDGTVQNTSSYNTNAFFRYNKLGISWYRFWNNISKAATKPSTDITESQFLEYFKDNWVSTYKEGETSVSGYDISLCKTYDALKTSHESGYNISVFSTSSDSWNNQLQGKPRAMLNQLEDDFGARIYGATGTDNGIVNQGTGINDLLSNVTDDIVYLIGKGTVKDVIGEDFDLVISGDTCPFNMTRAGNNLTATKIDNNHWGFGAVNEGVWEYEVTYDPETESFEWKINVPIESAKQLELSYDLQLMTLKNGTYDTNKSATLDYTSSDGKTTGVEPFEKPTVTYTVPAPMNYYTVTTSAVGGTIDPTTTVTQGSDKTVNYKPNDGYTLKSVTVDGIAVDITKYPSSYTFTGISANHIIDVVYEKTPIVEDKYTITTNVKNGKIDKTITGITKGDSKTVSYSPSKGYELKSVTVDGTTVDTEKYPNKYTFKDITSNHEIKVVYAKKGSGQDTDDPGNNPKKPNNGNGDSPDTGDQNDLTGWIAMLLAALTAAVTIEIYRKRTEEGSDK
ncbi:MAG: VWA domain-containing protein [Clostridiales bacterium]|nr:VWA domain-containing protein [Clostridiales bacterium]